MCISNQRECIKNNPPLVCCAVNVCAFVLVLFTAGIYIVHFPVNIFLKMQEHIDQQVVYYEVW